MPALDYKGPPPVASTDLVTYDYVASLLPSGLSTTAVNDRINTNLAGKVLRSYVDTQDLLNATQAYVDVGDATRLKLTDKDVVNGVLSLGPSGRAAPSRFDVASTQRWNAGLWTPSAYNASALSAVAAESTVYPMSVTDPGFTYKIVVFGIVDASTGADSGYPIVTVRDGSTAGTVIAEGRGAADSYLYSTGMSGGDDFERTDASYIGNTLWAPQYSQGNTSRGYDSIPNGHEVQWNDTGGQSAYVLHRRINAADALTQTDDQLVTLTQGSIVSETTLNFDPDDASTMLICRMSTDFNNMVYVGLTSVTGGHQAIWGYRKNGTFSAPGVQSGISQAANDGWALNAVGRVYTLYKNGTQVSQWNDSSNVTNVGSSFRGWGFGHQAASRAFSSGQTTPSSVADIRIQDNPTLTATAPCNVLPINYASQSPRTGASTLFVRVNRSASPATVGVSTFFPKLVAFAVPA